MDPIRALFYIGILSILLISLYAWLVTVSAIARSDTIRAVKIFLFLLITAFPFVCFFYAFRKRLKSELDAGSGRMVKLAKVSGKAGSKTAKWLSEK